MLIVMDKDASPEQIQAVVAKIEVLGFVAQPIPGGERVAIGILRNPRPLDPALFLDMPGVTQAIPVSKPYKLVSREMKREDTVIHAHERFGAPMRQSKAPGSATSATLWVCLIRSELPPALALIRREIHTITHGYGQIVGAGCRECRYFTYHPFG